MLAGLGIFVAWLAITGRSSAVASAITGDAPGASSGGGSNKVSLAPAAPDIQKAQAISWTTIPGLGGAGVLVPSPGGVMA